MRTTLLVERRYLRLMRRKITKASSKFPGDSREERGSVYSARILGYMRINVNPLPFVVNRLKWAKRRKEG